MNRSVTFAKEPNEQKIILGIDVGTSGVRGCVVKRHLEQEKIIAEFKVAMATPNETTSGIHQAPQVWLEALKELFIGIRQKTDLKLITHIIVDATSSTVLLTDNFGKPLTHALMYNDSLSINQAGKINAKLSVNGEFSGATGNSSTLAKALRLLDDNPTLQSPVICHQADCINHYLCGSLGVTDENNALKLGFDSINQAWPIWVADLLDASGNAITLPKVVTPGSLLATVTSELVETFGFNPETKVLAGTTDSIAGFLASGASLPGDAVSSLGSTLAIKIISKTPVFNSDLGLYSHRLADYWLIGGASNSGGRVLAEHYTSEQLNLISQSIDRQQAESFYLKNSEHFYPLLSKGERFPVADANLEPIMPAKPSCSLSTHTPEANCLLQHKLYFQQVSIGLAQVEQLAYEKLMNLGVQPISNIYSVGGGTQNQAWMFFREQLLPGQLQIAENLDAAYGVTKLVK